MTDKCFVLILSSGSGNRFLSKIPKQFLKIQKKSILERSVEIFNNHPAVGNIIVVTHPSYLSRTRKMLGEHYSKLNKIIPGGQTRQQSAWFGLQSIVESDGIVLIHDAARPFVTTQIISDCISQLQISEAVATGIPVTDTLYHTSGDKCEIIDIPDRKDYYYAQTPQGFRLSLIRRAHQIAIDNIDLENTDDAGLVLKYKLADVVVVPGNLENFKITYKIDLKLAKILAKGNNPKLLL